MTTPTPDPAAAWATEWLDAVASGTDATSQRQLAAVLQRGGGLPAIRTLARSRGLHLRLLTDDRGDRHIAASLQPFPPAR